MKPLVLGKSHCSNCSLTTWRGVLDTTLCDKVCDLRQDCGFLLFPPQITVTAMI